MRFEVLCNGRRVCLAGLDGDGVLSVGVTYVKHQDGDGKVGFHVGGLGRYDGSADDPRHANWSTVGIATGDEITIRLLPPGEFDEPVGMTARPKATREDADFGTMSLYVDAWLADVPFPSPPIETARVRIRAGESGPSDRQRDRYRELVQRIPSHWPEIALALVRCHSEIETIEQLAQRIRTRVGVELEGDESESVGLSFRFVDDPGNRCYFVTLRDWQIVEVSSAD